MASKGVINELVNDKVFSDEERLLAGLKALNDEFTVSIRNAKLFSDSLAGAKSLKDINVNSAKAAQELEKLKKLMQDTAKATDQASAASIRRQQAEERAAASSEKAAQKAAKLKSEYEQLNAEHIKLRANAQNLGVVFGTNSKQFLDAAKNANVLDEKLKDIDKQLGKSNRFVGEYERGNRGLSNSINQLTRELPAFTFSAQTGFLALSNNLPIFFDQIKQTREEIVRLRQAGEKAPSLFSQLAGSFFTLGTVLSIGVTLLTVYGKEIGEFAASLFKGTEAINQFTERQKVLAEAFKNTDYKTAITNVIELKDEINLAKEGFIDKDAVVKHYNETIGKTTGLVNNLDEAEKAINKNANNYIKFTYLKAAANLALESASKKALEIEQARLKTPEQSASFGDKALSYLGNFGSSTEFDPDSEKNLKANIAKRGAATQKAVISQGEKDLKDLEKVFTNLNKQAADIAKKNNFNFFNDNQENKTRKSKTTKSKKEKAEVADYDLTEEKLAFENRKKLLDDYFAEEKRLREQSIADLTEFSETELLSIQDRANQSLIINEEAYARGEIGKAQYEKNKLDIEHEATVASINEQIRLAKSILDIQDKAGIDTKAQRKALSDFERKLAKEDADYQISQLKTVGEAKKAQNQAIKELAQEVFDFGVGLVNASFETEKNNVQEQKDALTEQTASEIDAVNRSIGTQQEKADKIAIINAKAKAQQDVLDLRKREIAIRQAKFDKAVALSSVVQNTYAGAARALKDYPFPFSSIIAGLVIATGLASAANIIATPIPKYAKGTNYHKGGGMIVGDAGTELVIEPSGRQYLTPDTDTFTTAPTGTKVIPHHEVIRMLAKPDAVQYVGGQSVDIQQLVAAQKQTTKAIQSQKMMGTLVTKKGWARQQGRVSSWNNHKRNYLN